MIKISFYKSSNSNAHQPLLLGQLKSKLPQFLLPANHFFDPLPLSSSVSQHPVTSTAPARPLWTFAIQGCDLLQLSPD